MAIQPKLVVDLVDVETEIHSAISALNAVTLCHDDNPELFGQIDLIKVMLDCSLRYLAKNSLETDFTRPTVDKAQ